MSLLKDILRDLSVAWKRFTCKHDYEVDHYGNRCCVEICKKCGHVIQHGR